MQSTVYRTPFVALQYGYLFINLTFYHVQVFIRLHQKWLFMHSANHTVTIYDNSLDTEEKVQKLSLEAIDI